MVYTFRRKVRSAALYLCVLPFSLFSRNGFLKRMGWFTSVRRRVPVDNTGAPLPWWSYSAILFLQDRLRKDMRVFEYGSGYSTLWLASRVRSVVSIETEKVWYQNLKNKLPSNVQLSLVVYETDGKYCRLVSDYAHEVDIVIVDSRDRARCAKNAVDSLGRNGVLIFDDAHKPKFKEARDYIAGKGYRAIDFFGEGPESDNTHCTSIFYGNDNCLGI